MTLRLPLLLLLLATVASAQTRIAGTVEDASGLGLAGASVVVEGTRWGAATDGAGRFEIVGVGPGTVTVAASRVGYASDRVEVTVTDGAPAEVRLVLVEVALDPGEVVVTAPSTCPARVTTSARGRSSRSATATCIACCARCPA